MLVGDQRIYKSHRIFTVSNRWVTVTAPQAAIPPATNALNDPQLLDAHVDLGEVLPCRGRHDNSCGDMLISYLWS